MNSVDDRLGELGLALPEVGPASGTYLPFRRAGSLLFVSGQVPRVNGADAFIGLVGADLTIDEGREAARVAALQLLARVRLAVEGDWDKVAACVQLRGFVNAAPDFREHPRVIDGASDLLVAVLGERGAHARTALGAGSLPRGFAVEIDAVFDLAA